MPYEKRHFYRDYITRNEDFRRAPYNPELEFYSAIKTGDITSLRKFLAQPLHEKEGMGKLSDDPLRNMKYHFTVTAALAARSCVVRNGRIRESSSAPIPILSEKAWFIGSPSYPFLPDQDILTTITSRIIRMDPSAG